LARFPFQLLNGRPQIAAQSSAFQSTRSSVLDTTYFFAASIVRANGFRPIRHRQTPTAMATATVATLLPSSGKSLAKDEGVGAGEVSVMVTMQRFRPRCLHDGSQHPSSVTLME
jgi:hypothetical protein